MTARRSPVRQMLVESMVTARLPTASGEFRLSLFRNDQDDKEHLALVRGDLGDGRDVLVRIHSECFTGDVLGSARCDCGAQLSTALARIDAEGRGAVLYLRQEGRGIGLLEKLKAYNLQDLGYDTVDANRLLGHAPDERDYGLAARMLDEMGVRSIRLLTNNPAKISGLVENGIEVLDRVPTGAAVNAENAAYLRTKVERLRHRLDLEALLPPPADDEASSDASSDSAPSRADVASDSLGDDIAEVHEWLAGFDPGGEVEARPFVTLTYAQSIDGCIAVRRDQPLAISGPQSRAFTHELRAAHDAILVGIGTVLADDPRLTVRLVDAGDPQPVVLDCRLRFPLDARLLSGPGPAPWIVTSESADRSRQAALEDAGAEVLRLPVDDHGRISIDPLLSALAERGVRSLMVEGGATVISSFLAARRVDHLVLTVAPMLVGGVPAIARLPVNGDDAAGDDAGARPSLPRLRGSRYRRLGDDLIFWGAPVWS